MRRIWLSVLLLALASGVAWAAERGVVLIKDQAGREVGLYKASYALLIGISDYTAGWPDLESVPRELERVERTLKGHGFHVIKHLDPNARQLERAFEAFIDRYGYDPQNRLLFFFSGHGHTRLGGEKGYLVPTDAPLPQRDEHGFLRKALPMTQILAWTREVEAKHALFMFDSCFSGTVFKTKASPPRPQHITRATALAVRQFITAGSAGETVPAKSVFTQAFVDALEYRWGDLNEDGYITGIELGLYLQAKVPQHFHQSPQFGKHPDYELSRGDFVFELAGVERTAKLTVRSNLQGDTVYIDGEPMGNTPLDAELAPGTHTVRVEKAGYRTKEKAVELSAGSSRVERFDMKRTPTPEVGAAPQSGASSRPPGLRGNLQVNVNVDAAKVSIDGIDAGVARHAVPLLLSELTVGQHRVRVQAEGYETQERRVNIRPNEWGQLGFELRRRFR